MGEKKIKKNAKGKQKKNYNNNDYIDKLVDEVTLEQAMVISKKKIEEHIEELKQNIGQEESEKKLEKMQLLIKKHMETMDELFPKTQIHNRDKLSQKKDKK